MVFTDTGEPSSPSVEFDNANNSLSVNGKTYIIEWENSGSVNGIKDMDFKLEGVYSGSPQGSVSIFEQSGKSTEPLQYQGGAEILAKVVSGSGTLIEGSFQTGKTREIQVGESAGDHNPTIKFEPGKYYVWVAGTDGMQLLKLKKPGDSGRPLWIRTVVNAPGVPEDFAETVSRVARESRQK